MQTRRNWVVAGAGLALAAAALAGQNGGSKGYRDPNYGVNFQYPAQWTVDASRQFGPLEPTILRELAEGKKPLVRVGFSAAAGARMVQPSTLEGAEFVVVVAAAKSAKDCRESVKWAGATYGSGEINGVEYWWSSGDGEAPGHKVYRTLHATYRQHRCYVYEEDIHESLGVAEDGVHMLRPEERAEIQHALDAVMGSVQYLGGLAK